MLLPLPPGLVDSSKSQGLFLDGELVGVRGGVGVGRGEGGVPSLQPSGRGRPRAVFFFFFFLPSWPKKEKEVSAEMLTTESFKKGVGIMTEKRTKLALDKDNYTN